jgi:hypothetical protein
VVVCFVFGVLPVALWLVGCCPLDKTNDSMGTCDSQPLFSNFFQNARKPLQTLKKNFSAMRQKRQKMHIEYRVDMKKDGDQVFTNGLFFMEKRTCH